MLPCAENVLSASTCAENLGAVRSLCKATVSAVACGENCE